MKWGTKQRVLKLANPRRKTLTSGSSAEFFALCDRERAGEFRVSRLSRGKGNADWVFDVWLKEKVCEREGKVL